MAFVVLIEILMVALTATLMVTLVAGGSCWSTRR